MILIGFNSKGDLLDALYKLSEITGSQLVIAKKTEDINHIEATAKKCFFCTDLKKEELKPLLLKGGSRAGFVWITDKRSPQQLSSDVLLQETNISKSQIQSVTLPRGLSSDEISQKLFQVTFQPRAFKTFENDPDLSDRLKLIHEITHFAIHTDEEKAIRQHIMHKLVQYYSAESCSCLAYNDKGELLLLSSINGTGTYQTYTGLLVPNPEDYKECMQCGEPVINCRKPAVGANGYICAPLLESGMAQGLLRIQYRHSEIDITLDRTVLKISAGILSAAQIRARASEKLKESEQRALNILNTTADGIIMTDESGIIESFNKSAELIFGFSQHEITGKNAAVLMPQAETVWYELVEEQLSDNGLASYTGKTVETIGVRKSGESFPIQISVSKHQTSNMCFYTGIVRDVTEERRLEQEVMRISEHERHRIGQDLHDGLGQMLSGIGLLSASIKKRLQHEKHPLAEQMAEITSLLQEADEYARGLAHGLVKIDLERGGFHAAIEKLILQSQKLFRIDCKLVSDQEIEIRDRARAEHVYRIIQEAISNAVKHGYSTKVTVGMTYSERKLLITIRDNGTGFSSNWRKKRGLGVRIMEFRSRLINGQFSHGNNPGKGAVITLTIPSP
ncbi:MAG: PAS domain S-box protein [Balneolales bacterium]|nr:PAS domain S-box protein [Balneolales bacterium]